MTQATQTQPSRHKIILPDIPVLCVNARQAAILTTEGEIRVVDHQKAKDIVKNDPVMVCHAPYTAKTLKTETLSHFDLLELFAFVHPAKFCVPTPVGLSQALGISPPESFDDYPISLMECAKGLLSDLRKDIWQAKANPLKIASVMGAQGNGWAWTPFIFEALGEKYDARIPVVSKLDLNVWKNLPEWSEEAPPPPPSHHPVTKEEAKKRLQDLLGTSAETRQQQLDYAETLTAAFAPKDQEDEPNLVLAEAGTGVGKTLGYLSPASVWAEKNQGTVWVSTYTKNLQRQVDQELDRLYPNEDLKDNKVAIRKGRENYLCLLNLSEAAAGASLAKNTKQAIALGIMARWTAATKTGDLVSGPDFPGWLNDLIGFQYTAGLSDKRGECLYSACDHYHKCFVEQSARRAQHAALVIANHALVMIKTADANEDSDLPLRYIFDESHHLFDAADSAFAGHLTARETYEMRRWIRGNEASGKTSRMRGLKSRAEDLISGDEKMLNDLTQILEQARHLTNYGWQKRLKENQPKGVTETFILKIYGQVYNRTQGQNHGYSLETETFPISEDLKKPTSDLKEKLKNLQTPMLSLATLLRKKLIDQSDTLEKDTRKRIDALCSSLRLKSQTLSAWIGMLETLEQQTTHTDFIDWMEIERFEGRTFDIGLYRHWVNPIIPFSANLKPHAHGIVMTSATLQDNTEDVEKNKQVALDRTGADLLTKHVIEKSYSSPFNYTDRTKIFVITDVQKNDIDQIASAYKTLFTASNGGAIGLFTAISRLRAVHEKINIPLSDKNIPLYGQHVDRMDTGTLVDIFREEENACLLGTDAIRDGVDVPGNSLRLIVFDRVPWPRPTILHKARREAFGKKQYDDMLTRLKLKQAYGRLIRRANDKGVFVMLDSMMPSRISDAFPKGVEIERVGLAEAATKIQDFLKTS